MDCEQLQKKFGMLDDSDVEKLSTALVCHYEPELVSVEAKLAELSKKQQALIEKLHYESNVLDLTSSEYNLQDIFTKVKVYHAKLVTLKKDMAQLHDKSTKLKKRGLRLQEQRQKEALQRELQ